MKDKKNPGGEDDLREKQQQTGPEEIRSNTPPPVPASPSLTEDIFDQPIVAIKRMGADGIWGDTVKVNCENGEIFKIAIVGAGQGNPEKQRIDQLRRKNRAKENKKNRKIAKDLPKGQLALPFNTPPPRTDLKIRT